MDLKQKNVLGALTVIVVGLLLPVTIFIVNQQNPQDIRQQAATPTPSISIAPEGCPTQNPDRSTNTCRPTLYCNSGETVKYEGNEECTRKLNKESFCCTKPLK